MSQKFCIIFITFVSYFNLQQKHPSIRNKGHHAVPSEITFLPILGPHANINSCLLRWRTPLLKLPPPFGFWSIMRTESKPWIRTSNNFKELGLDNKLGSIPSNLNSFTEASTMSTESEPLIRTNNNFKELRLDNKLGSIPSNFWSLF